MLRSKVNVQFSLIQKLSIKKQSHQLRVKAIVHINSLLLSFLNLKSGPSRNAVRGQNISYKGSNIEQGNFIIDANGVKEHIL